MRFRIATGVAVLLDNPQFYPIVLRSFNSSKPIRYCQSRDVEWQTSMSKSTARNSNLDLLRAAAIVAVILFHVSGMWPINYPQVHQFAKLGRYGVTLFFVLSGWLIGHIYWRDCFGGDVKTHLNFWIRRWIRTIPPYLVGMLLGYLAVRVVRGEAFDWRYLYFAQNYARQIPFYVISWSLCVEEHFYLLLPLVGCVLCYASDSAKLVILWSLSVAPLIFRVIDPNAGVTGTFGYAHSASHLVFEGLALGVAAAFTAKHFPQLWNTLVTYSRRLRIIGLLLVFSVAWWSADAEYYVGKSLIAVVSLIWLMSCVDRPPSAIAAHPLTHAIAISSYSLYLTNSLAIHLALRLAMPSDTVASQLVCLVAWTFLISGFGAVFYWLVERQSIVLRDWISLKRSRNE